MVTPHLPPEQAANSLLPVQLASELMYEDVTTTFVSHPALSGETSTPGQVTYVPRRPQGVVGSTLAGAALAATRLFLATHRALKHADPDLVHVHSNGLIIEVAAVVARRLRKPYIMTLYGTDIWHHEPKENARFADVVHRAAHRVFYSNALMEFAGPLGLATEPSSVIYAPVAARFHPVSDGRRRELQEALHVDGSPILLTVKRLHPVAGYEDLFTAMPAIVARYPSARLLVVGDGEMRPALEAKLAELGMETHVRLLGPIPNEQLQPYYAGADLFVLPSRLESWGTVMLEALSCGTPVVASDTAGASEVRSVFGEEITLFERADPKALSRAVVDRLERLGRVGADARTTLHDHFSAAACAKRYLGVYREALG